MSALLSVSDAHVAYGKVEAVRAVSLDVLEGAGDAKFCDFLRWRVIDAAAVYGDRAAR